MTKTVKSYRRRVKRATAWTRFVDRVELTLKVIGLLFFIGLALLAIFK